MFAVLIIIHILLFFGGYLIFLCKYYVFAQEIKDRWSSFHALFKSWPLILLYHNNCICTSWNLSASGHSYWLLLFTSFTWMINSHKNSMAEYWNVQRDWCCLSWVGLTGREKNCRPRPSYRQKVNENGVKKCTVPGCTSCLTFAQGFLIYIVHSNKV